VYKILLEFQLKEQPIAYTKWGKCLMKDRRHTLTCIKQTLFFTFNYLELNKLKIFIWKLIHFITVYNRVRQRLFGFTSG
jgi:hypothetical protein